MNARGGAGPIEIIRVLSYQSVLCSACIEGGSENNSHNMSVGDGIARHGLHYHSHER
jgi:hypothetical protein